jgi:site-specific DNA-methyltransferase (adenine-specific)
MPVAQSVEWRTPRVLFAELEAEFGAFDLDPAATRENALCPHFYTKEQDGLRQPWFGRVFCNPPYGGGLGRWIAKGIRSVLAGDCSLVVFLLPVRSDTSWFHSWLWNRYDHRPKAHVQLRFIKGRLKFNGRNPAVFPSMLAIIQSGREGGLDG